MAAKKEQTALQEFKAALKSKTLGNFYVLHGEESFLTESYFAQIKKQIIDPVTEEFNFHRFTQENLNLRQFAECLEMLPVMAEHTLLQVDDVDLFSLDEESRTSYAKLLSDLPPECCVVFTYRSVSFKPDKRKKALADAFARAVVVEFQRQTERDLGVWIARHFAAQGKAISPELCRYLILLTGGSMTAMSGEIAKISAYTSGEEIRKSDIDAVVEPVLEAVTFDISNALAEGNFDLALRKLQEVLAMQEEPIPILAAVGAQMRRLHAACVLRDSGKGADQLAGLCGISDYPARLTMKQARGLSTERCAKALILCMQADEQIKSSYDDAVRILELLFVRLSQEVFCD